MFSTGRNQRNTTQMYNPMRTYASYCTEALQKTEMKRDFEDIKLDFENEVFLKNLHLIPDPLMKNLADTLVTAEKPEKARKLSLETPEMIPKAEVRPESTFAGITNFFSGVFSMLSGAMFRPRSPAPYYDFDADSHQGSPLSWRRANIDDEDKNGQTFDKLSSDAPSSPHGRSDMNINCKSPVTSCEEKLNHVKYLLKSPKPSSNPTRLRRRPKKVFVEPGSVEESLEDAFTPEDLVALPNDPTIECCSPRQWQNEGLVEAHPPKTKIDIGYINETTEIVKDVMEDTKDAQIDKGTVNNENQLVKLENKNVKPETDAVNVEKDAIKAENDAVDVKKDVVNVEKDAIKAEKDVVNVEKDVVKLENDKTKLESPKNDSDLDPKQQLVSSCEDKLSKLKALLQEKCKKNTNTNTTPDPITEPLVKPAKTIPILKPVDKHFKNPHRMLDKRRKMKMKRSIQDDVCFANEIEVDASSVDNSPSTINSSSDASLGDYFDELKGRFHSASTTESEDSFQIVFNDVPKRCRKVSDCDSEDSFIVFEDSPDCFTSNDVFCEESDSESDVSDSGCGTMTCKLAHSLSRTVSNLTDDTLYESGDEVDCARVAPELKIEESKGLLLDAHKKSLRKNQLPKKVTFSSQPPKVKVMRVWAYAARQARAGHWERFALDRDRFKRRIDDVDMAVSWVLKPQHRSRVMFQRFMPWWNAQRRKELAEKKEKDEERKRAEAERVEEEKKQEAKLLEGNGSQDVNDITEDSVDKIQDSIEGGDVKKDVEGSIQNETEKKSEVDQAIKKKAEIESKNRIHTAPKNDSKNTKINDNLKKNTNSVPNIRGTCKKIIVHKIPKEKMANYESNKIANDVCPKVIKTEPKTNVVNKNSANFNGGIDT